MSALDSLANRLALQLELPDHVVYGVAEAAYKVFQYPLHIFVTSLHQIAPQLVEHVDSFTAANIHPFAKKLPLMTPSYVLFAVLAYYSFLVVLYPVGKVMSVPKIVGLVHNLFLFGLSLYMVVTIMVTARSAGFSLWNNGVGNGPHDWRLAKLIWLFYVSKIPEFGDTFIMMMKKNYHQISFLHLYHHSTIFVIWFLTTLIAPGGEAYWSAMVNSGVHVFMYGYYFGTMICGETSVVRKFLNSIKFIITKGQMTQFAANCVQSVYDLSVVHPNYHTGLIKILFWYMLTLLALFANFLMRNNKKGKSGVKRVSDPSAKTSPSPTQVQKNKQPVKGKKL